MKKTLFAVALCLCALGARADVAGLEVVEIGMPHHENAARVAIWYPSSSQETSELYADNPVFQGVEAHRNGPMAQGRFPVVLFSHGMGGSDRAQAWLGAALAQRGAIGVFVNHPNTTWGDFDMSRGVAHWTRAQDMQVALDAVLARSDLAPRVDRSRIMVAGFSFGGWTALSLGGAKGNHAGLVAACQKFAKMAACDVLMSREVNLPEMDPSQWNASYADARVTHVTAIDPGLVWGLTGPDLDDLLPGTRLIGLGREGDRMLATDFDRSGMIDQVRDPRVVRLEPAFHFSVMPICKPAGAAILAEEGDDPVCSDPVGTDRAQIHAQIIGLIAKDLGL